MPNYSHSVYIAQSAVHRANTAGSAPRWSPTISACVTSRRQKTKRTQSGRVRNSPPQTNPIPPIGHRPAPRRKTCAKRTQFPPGRAVRIHPKRTQIRPPAIARPCSAPPHQTNPIPPNTNKTQTLPAPARPAANRRPKADAPCLPFQVESKQSPCQDP